MSAGFRTYFHAYDINTNVVMKGLNIDLHTTVERAWGQRTYDVSTVTEPTEVIVLLE